MDGTLDRVLVQVLDKHGHGIYLRHPETGEIVLVAHEQDGRTAAAARRRLERVLAGILREARQP